MKRIKQSYVLLILLFGTSINAGEKVKSPRHVSFAASESSVSSTSSINGDIDLVRSGEFSASLQESGSGASILNKDDFAAFTAHRTEVSRSRRSSLASEADPDREKVLEDLKKRRVTPNTSARILAQRREERRLGRNMQPIGGLSRDFGDLDILAVVNERLLLDDDRNRADSIASQGDVAQVEWLPGLPQFKEEHTPKTARYLRTIKSAKGSVEKTVRAALRLTENSEALADNVVNDSVRRALAPMYRAHYSQGRIPVTMALVPEEDQAFARDFKKADQLGCCEGRSCCTCCPKLSCVIL